MEMRVYKALGEGGSLALTRDNVVIVQDHLGDSKIFAFDKHTGEKRWERARDEPSNWATPLVVTHDGVEQVITSGASFIRSYDAQSGELVWQCLDPNEESDSSALSSPVAGLGKVFCAPGFLSHTLAAIDLSETDDAAKAISWVVDDGAPYVPSPLLYDDRIYFVSENKASLSCYNASTGTPIYTSQRLKGLSSLYASPVGAAGRIYIADRNGDVMVLKHSDNFEILAINSLDEGFDASPIIVGNELYLKGEHHLYCIAVP